MEWLVPLIRSDRGLRREHTESASNHLRPWCDVLLKSAVLSKADIGQALLMNLDP